jgi:hypothetical protein
MTKRTVAVLRNRLRVPQFHIAIRADTLFATNYAIQRPVIQEADGTLLIIDFLLYDHTLNHRISLLHHAARS